MALTSPTVRVKAHVQTAAEKQAVYDYVTARDKTCRAPLILGNAQLNWMCRGRDERHHAGNKMGSKRITSRRTVVLLCAWHHANWAPTHSRVILEWLAAVEDAKESVPPESALD